jgi:hypothetical protein
MRAVFRHGARMRTGAALGALAALACGTPGPYDAYRAQHPGWDGEFAREGASPEEVVAGLYAPATSEDSRIEVVELQLWRAQGDQATPIDVDDWRRGDVALAPDADVMLIAHRRCHAQRGLEESEVERVGYYLFPALRLEAFDDYAFGRTCAVTNSFRAARGPTVPLERAAAQRVASDFGRMPVDPAQLYRRGLAYLEAGRVTDAEAVLTVAEPGFRAASAHVQPGTQPPEAYTEAARLRAQLMRALGVKAVPSAPR